MLYYRELPPELLDLSRERMAQVLVSSSNLSAHISTESVRGAAGRIALNCPMSIIVPAERKESLIDDPRQEAHDYMSTWQRGEGSGLFGMPVNHAEKMAVMDLELHTHAMAAMNAAGRRSGGDIPAQNRSLGGSAGDVSNSPVWGIFALLWLMFLAGCGYVVYRGMFHASDHKPAVAQTAKHKPKIAEHHGSPVDGSPAK